MNLRRLAHAIGVLLLIASVPPSHATGKKAEGTAAQLLNQALSRTGIREKDSPPFRMTARIQLARGSKKSGQGTYELIWASPGSWREEVSLPEYRRLRAAHDGWLVTQQTGPYQPLNVFDLDELLDLSSRRADISERSIKKDRTKKKRPTLRCISVEDEPSDAEFCIEQGQLLRETHVKLKTPGFVLKAEYEYDGFHALGTKGFPRELRMSLGERPCVSVVVEGLEELEQVDPAWFRLPQGTRTSYPCESVDEAGVRERRQMGPGDFSEDSGFLALRFVVAADGSLHDYDVLKSSSSEMKAFVLNQLSADTWSPAFCDGRPVDSVVRRIKNLSMLGR